MISGVKITLTICMTILVSCALFIGYNEYTNRYSLIASEGDSLYIFDKKNVMLSRCKEGHCELVETKLPSGGISLFKSDNSTSKLFGPDKTMSGSTVKAQNTPEQADEPPTEIAKTPPIAQPNVAQAAKAVSAAPSAGVVSAPSENAVKIAAAYGGAPAQVVKKEEKFAE
jgi:hypothetical protein